MFDPKNFDQPSPSKKLFFYFCIYFLLFTSILWSNILRCGHMVAEWCLHDGHSFAATITWRFCVVYRRRVAPASSDPRKVFVFQHIVDVERQTMVSVSRKRLLAANTDCLLVGVEGRCSSVDERLSSCRIFLINRELASAAWYFGGCNALPKC